MWVYDTRDTGLGTGITWYKTLYDRHRYFFVDDTSFRGVSRNRYKSIHLYPGDTHYYYTG